MQTVPVTTPRPMRRFKATLVRSLRRAFQRRRTGKAAPMKSVIIEKTIASQRYFLPRYSGKNTPCSC